MATKEILVFADGADDVRTRVELAWAIARRNDAHLEACVPAPLPLQPYGFVPPSVQQAYQQVVSADEARAADVVSSLAAITPFGPHFSAHALSVPYDKIRAASAVAAHAADLVVLGQPEAWDNTSVDTEVLLGALFGGGAPCLMFPRWIETHVWGRRALVAWKGTPQAARALRAAMPLLAEADSVRLVVVDPRTEWEGEDHRSVMRVATHIARHGVKLEDPVVVKSDIYDHAVEAAIAEELESFNADFLVMGAYGHQRWTEVVFGGVSQGMIRNARVPIFLAH